MSIIVFGDIMIDINYFSKIENLDNEEIFSQIDQLNYTESYSKMLLSSEEYIIDRFPKLKQNIIDHTNVYLFDRLGFEPFKYYFSDSWFVIRFRVLKLF